MVKKNDFVERLDAINKKLDEMLNDVCCEISVSVPKDLAVFGLTLNEAKSWLKNEPNFSSDVSYHEPRNRRKVNRTSLRILYISSLVRVFFIKIYTSNHFSNYSHHIILSINPVCIFSFH